MADNPLHAIHDYLVFRVVGGGGSLTMSAVGDLHNNFEVLRRLLIKIKYSEAFDPERYARFMH